MFRPCIDIHDGKVKQIVGGSLTQTSVVENFVSQYDSKYYAKLFQEDGLVGGHVIMLGPGNEEEAVSALLAYPKGLQVGGGITAENAKYYIDKGASHVIVTSYVFKDGLVDFNRLQELVACIGKKQLVLDLSCRKKNGTYYVVTDRWQKFTDYAITKENMMRLEQYCDEFLIHGVDVEGKQQGIAEDLVQIIAEWTSIPVTYAGGIRSLEDIKRIHEIGKGRIHFTVGSALDIFGGSLSYREVVDLSKKLDGGNN